MRKRKIVLFFIVLALLMVTPVFGDTLKTGSTGTQVMQLQTKLKSLGYFNSNATGYYGNLTRSAVLKFQAKSGLKQDGIAGVATQTALSKTGTSSNIVANRGNSNAYSTVSNRGDVNRKEDTYDSSNDDGKYGELLDWWSKVDGIFYRGAEAKVIDLWTGKSFNIMRTYGRNHADCETKTAEDTKIMKEIYGGNWSWNRRPIIVVTGDKRIAASMAGMPHAGLDSKPKNVTVKGRSGGYGTGTNLDTVKGNNMDGHFDIHFLNSRTHGTNKVDSAHQKAVKQATGK